MNNQTNKSSVSDRLISMIDSCFAYGGADVDSYNFKEYILPFRDKMREEEFNCVYEIRLNWLKENCEVVTNVYTDMDGLTYNELKLK